MNNSDNSLVFKTQVDKSLYFSSSYLSPERFSSYAYQLKEILLLKPRNVLEIGPGNGVLTYLLRKANIDVTTLDFDSSLNPDIVASVTDIPLPDNSFDTVVCFQVLEHLPFYEFQKALKEIYRVAGEYAILSLPDSTRAHRFELWIPKLGIFKRLIQFPRIKTIKHVFLGDHYWEIGKYGYPLQKIIGNIKNIGFEVEKTFRVYENPYHRFFILKKPSMGIRILYEQ